MQQGINVITPNKKLGSGPLEQYQVRKAEEGKGRKRKEKGGRLVCCRQVEGVQGKGLQSKGSAKAEPLEQYQVGTR